MGCYTNLYIRGSKPELKKLHALLKKWTAKNMAHSNFGKNGIENIIMGAGLSQEKYACQAVIDYIDKVLCYGNPEDGYFFNIDYTSEKKPMPQLWYAILEKFAPNCKAYWFAMDSDNNFYMTNDKNHVFINFDYIVHCKVHEENPLSKLFIPEDSFSSQELRLALVEVCNPKPLEEMIKQAKTLPLEDDEVFAIHKIRVMA